MDISHIQNIAVAVEDAQMEGELYAMVEDLRLRVPLAEPVTVVKSRTEAIERGLDAVTVAIKEIADWRGLAGVEAGHGPGHWARDYIHSLRIALDHETPLNCVVPCIVAGTLHDIGTLFVDRYADVKRAVRHAEVGALVVQAALRDEGVLTQEEVSLSAYAIAAHTHYLRESEVLCADGVKRLVKPWPDKIGHHAPFLPVWLPRMADRLDCNGPCFVGRHYLTLHRDHQDYGTDGFYDVSFAEHMRPVRRSDEVIKAEGGKRTMLEHVSMFAASQTSSSIYGRNDFGVMKRLRDTYRTSLNHIIAQVDTPSDVDSGHMSKTWKIFLGGNIEPSRVGRDAAHDLGLRFETLPIETQRAWACGFRAVMTEYLAWANRTNVFLETQPMSHLRLPELEDVREIITPSQLFVTSLTA